MNVINKSLNYNAKHNCSPTKNIWNRMLNFDNLPKSSWLAVISGTVYGCIYYISSLLEVQTLSWKDIIKSGEGIIYAVILAISVKISTDFYTLKLKHKIFKDAKTNKTKTKTDKAA